MQANMEEKRLSGWGTKAEEGVLEIKEKWRMLKKVE